MGLFDSIKQDVSGKIGNLAGGELASHLFSMFGGGNQSSGLSNIVNRFQDKGFGDIVSSWVGKGANKPISGEQVERVLGSDKLQEIAQKFGVSKDQVRDQLAQHLPEAVDRATPEGELPKVA